MAVCAFSNCLPCVSNRSPSRPSFMRMIPAEPAKPISSMPSRISSGICTLLSQHSRKEGNHIDKALLVLHQGLAYLVSLPTIAGHQKLCRFFRPTGWSEKSTSKPIAQPPPHDVDRNPCPQRHQSVRDTGAVQVDVKVLGP